MSNSPSSTNSWSSNLKWLYNGAANIYNTVRYNSKTIDNILIELTETEIASFNNHQIYYRAIMGGYNDKSKNTYTFVPDAQKSTTVLKRSDSPRNDDIDHIIKKIIMNDIIYYLIFMKSTQPKTDNKTDNKTVNKTVIGEKIYRLHYISFENNTKDYLFFPFDILEKPIIYRPKDTDKYFVHDVPELSRAPIMRVFGNKTLLKDSIILTMKILHSLYSDNSIMKNVTNQSMVVYRKNNQPQATKTKYKIQFELYQVDQDYGENIKNIGYNISSGTVAVAAAVAVGTVLISTGVVTAGAVIIHSMATLGGAGVTAVAAAGAIVTIVGTSMSFEGGPGKNGLIAAMYNAVPPATYLQNKTLDGYIEEINKIASEQKDKLTLESNITLSGGKRKTQRRKKMSKKSKSMKRSQRK